MPGPQAAQPANALLALDDEQQVPAGSRGQPSAVGGEAGPDDRGMLGPLVHLEAQDGGACAHLQGDDAVGPDPGTRQVRAHALGEPGLDRVRRIGIIGDGEGADGVDDVEGVAEVQAAGARFADAEVRAGRLARAVRVGGGASARARVGGSLEGACTPELEEPVLGGPLAAVDEASKLRGGGGVGADEEAQGGLVRDREGVEVDTERA